MRNTDKSFESMARLVCDESNIRVQFGDFSPHSDLKLRVIRLPNQANDLTLEKRIELLCYLLHEIGHMRETVLPEQPGSGVSNSDVFVYINLLEDVAIQKAVESYFGGSRDIYNYVIGKMLAKRKSCLEKVFVRQRYIDHVLNMFVDMEKLDYDPSTVSRRDNKRKSIIIIYDAYLKARKLQANNNNSWSYTESVSRSASALRAIFEGLPKGKGKGKGKGRGRGGNQGKADPADEIRQGQNAKENEADKLGREANQKSGDEARKHAKKQRDLEQAKQDSLNKSNQLKAEKKATDNTTPDGKKKCKDINKTLREGVDERRELKENISEDNEDWTSGDGEYAEGIEQGKELRKKEKQLREDVLKLVPTTCMGLNKVGSEFFATDITSLNQGTYGTLKRLFEVLKSIINPAESGTIDRRRLSKFFEEDKLYKQHDNNPEVKVSLGFLLDSSSSMTSGRRHAVSSGKKKYEGTDLEMCWNSFASIVEACVRLGRREIGNLQYAVTGFTHDHEVLKTFKKKHLASTLDDLKARYFDMYHGGTQVEDPMRDMFYQMRKHEGRKIVFIITDGQFRGGFIKSAWYKRGIRNGIKVVIVAIGNQPRPNRSGPPRTVLGREPQYVEKMEHLEGCLSSEIAKALR